MRFLVNSVLIYLFISSLNGRVVELKAGTAGSNSPYKEMWELLTTHKWKWKLGMETIERMDVQPTPVSHFGGSSTCV